MQASSLGVPAFLYNFNLGQKNLDYQIRHIEIIYCVFAKCPSGNTIKNQEFRT